MKYRTMDATQLKAYYGQFAKPEEIGRGMIIPRGGKNRGINGKSNLKYHLDFCGILLDKDNNETDVTMGFEIRDLIAEFYRGFGDEAIIIPGSKMTHDRHSSRQKHFYVTFDPNNVQFVVIGHKRYHDKDQTTKDLSDLAEFVCLGELNGEAYCWDYYVFSWSMDYNKVANRNDLLLSDAKYAACSRTGVRREMLRNFLQEKFDDVETLVAMQSIRSGNEFKAMSNQRDTGKADTKVPSGSSESGLFQQWNYRDELNHKETFVLDDEGRMVNPDSTMPWEGRAQYRNAETSTSNDWYDIQQNYVVIRYVRIGISQAAQYIFLQMPEVVTEAQQDAILILEQMLRNEVRQLLGKYDLLDRLARRGAEKTWSQQLQK